MVQIYLRALSKRGGVVNTTVANATSKALICNKYPNTVGYIDIESNRWAKSLFTRMNFVKRRKTSSKVDIPEGAHKEIEFLFLHDIVSKVEQYKIPPALIVNFDQTPIKYVPVGNETLAEKGTTNRRKGSRTLTPRTITPRTITLTLILTLPLTLTIMSGGLLSGGLMSAYHYYGFR